MFTFRGTDSGPEQEPYHCHLPGNPAETSSWTPQGSKGVQLAQILTARSGQAGIPRHTFSLQGQSCRRPRPGRTPKPTG